MEGKGNKIEKLGELVQPSSSYKDSFIAAAREFEAAGENIYMNHPSLTPEELEADFEKLLGDIRRREEEGINLPESRVPQTELWLVEGSQFVGWVKIRHRLNEKLLKEGGHIGYGIRPSKRQRGYGTRILELALQAAKKLGIEKALITCDDDNIGSARIIESNGGVLENKVENEGKLKRRYWVLNE